MINNLIIENLFVGYENNNILENLTLHINKGEVLAVIGQNGCGKSTLIKTIARIISDNKGNIIFEGVNLNKLNTWQLKQNGISYFVQGGMIFESLTVSDHFELALKGLDDKKSNLLIEESFAFFPALKNIMKLRGGNLSAGQRQIVSFAMLFIQETNCWLLDEPTAGLDKDSVKIVLDFLIVMKEKYQKTIILVEHNYQVAFALADRVGIIKNKSIEKLFIKEEFTKENFLETYLYN